MAEGIIGRMANRLKQIFEPADPFSDAKRKGRPYTAMGDEELANVSFPALDELRARAQSPERFQMTPRQFLEPYYGENLDREIAAARSAQRAQTLGGAFHSLYRKFYTQDYDKIDQPVNFEFQQDPIKQANPAYRPSENLARLNSPEYQGWGKRVEERLANPETREQYLKYLDRASMTPEEVGYGLRNPINEMLQVAEHEMGHAFTGAGHVGEQRRKMKNRPHLAQPREMSNALGKIQRDTYAIFGKRLDRQSITKFMEREKALKPEDRFKDYSRESKRGLRQIMEFYENNEEPWDWVKQNIGKFVQTPKPKTQPTV